MPYITTSDGVSLHYLDDGAGPPAVLVAGFTAPAESWVLQVPALLGAGYRVLRLDRRSHGRSDNPAFGQRMARHGQDLAEFLAALDLTDAVLIGGSMGASTIWAYADLHGTDRVRAVVSVDQTPKMVSDGDWQHGFYGLTPDNLGVFFRDGIPDTGRGLPPGEQMQKTIRLAGALQELAEPPRMADPRAPETRPLLQNHAEADWRDVIDRVTVPVLMVAGRQSQFWPCEHAEAAAAGNPLARSVVLEDCGHAANTDQPDAFNDAVLDLLRSL